MFVVVQAYTEGQDLQTQFGRGSALPLTSGYTYAHLFVYYCEGRMNVSTLERA